VALELRILTEGTNEQVTNNKVEDRNTQVELTKHDQKEAALPFHILKVSSVHLCQEVLPLKFSLFSSVPSGKSLVDDLN
jgi:hypothetical protein